MSGETSALSQRRASVHFSLGRPAFNPRPDRGFSWFPSVTQANAGIVVLKDLPNSLTHDEEGHHGFLDGPFGRTDLRSKGPGRGRGVAWRNGAGRRAEHPHSGGLERGAVQRHGEDLALGGAVLRGADDLRQLRALQLAGRHLGNGRANRAEIGARLIGSRLIGDRSRAHQQRADRELICDRRAELIADRELNRGPIGERADRRRADAASELIGDEPVGDTEHSDGGDGMCSATSGRSGSSGSWRARRQGAARAAAALQLGSRSAPPRRRTALLRAASRCVPPLRHPPPHPGPHTQPHRLSHSQPASVQIAPAVQNAAAVV
ncbi:Protein of unknown function [Gryllus bimaculatus]|nr:Protein of unknown function [Gryllus bimaculatus]